MPMWMPDWSGETCVIVASGPSAADVPLGLAKGKARCITINSSWRLAPWADMLFAADYRWWKSVNGCPEFTGIKATIDARAAREWGINRLHSTNANIVQLHRRGSIGWGGNSGFCALNLAANLHCKRILLVGYDLRIDAGLHWHGPHGEGLRNPTEAKLGVWRKAIDSAAKALAGAGIEVVNCSLVSALQSYKKKPFNEALSDG